MCQFRSIVLIVFTSLSFVSLAQKKDAMQCTFFNKDHIDEVLILGYHQLDHKFFQFGIGSVTSQLIYPKAGGRYLATGPIISSISMSLEARLLDSLLIAPQLSYWSNDFFAVMGLRNIKYGLNLITYTNTNDGNLVLRPEIGFVNYFDWMPFKGGYAEIVYGLNIPVLNPKFQGYNKPHNLAVRFYLKYR